MVCGGVINLVNSPTNLYLMASVALVILAYISMSLRAANDFIPVLSLVSSNSFIRKDILYQLLGSAGIEQMLDSFLLFVNFQNNESMP